ncbi:MAG: Gfo/Idh/MocA family oxidoreductase [Oscillospiraceae bacterium]|jgi:predicted dehydrogenase|nr:Gfo/Idh/MocA family oxidoreductase [Oscillospiraceae bacterium]
MINIAIVGAGVWGDTHAAIYKEHPQANPVAVCDKNVNRAKAIAAKYGIEAVYADVEKMLSAGGFDAVSIVTPDHLHADIAVACANAGKHMLIEKPIATTHTDVLRIVQASRRNGVRVMVDLHNRWSPPFAAARAAVENGELGTLRHGYFRLNDIQWVATDMLSWSAQSSILWFLGSHSLDTLQWLFGDEVVRVYSVSSRGVLDAVNVPAPDTYLTTLEFRNGGVAQMENSWITPNGNLCINDIKCAITGDKGAIAIDASSHNLIQQYTQDKAFVPDILVRNQIHGRVKGFAYESIRSFIDCLVADKPFIVSMEDAARATIAILAILESAEKRQPVDVVYDF